ncbi:flagellar hook-length control protein FliK [Vibrio hepatarius]|uniref:flagellar hook-length control protein FliK n=1 Tax=Vibrio hepatarius TaxID=171383 RepID=UPI00148B900C|nr:flagellar hook-length control protein FliK [Vibrio hepatarius]NOI12625.1 flagellar hook-length control protein FliK [Vibrio hepatarius]
MNINLSTVTETPKATKAASEVVPEGEEVVATEGFFAKLASLLTGGETKGEAVEGKQPNTVSDIAPELLASDEAPDDEDVVTEGEEGSKVKASETQSLDSKNSEEESTDTLLSKKGVSDVDESATSKPRAEATDKPAGAKGESLSSNRDAQKIVADNQEVLKRLNDSNNALKVDNGKPLPQAEVADVSEIADTSEVADAVATSTNTESVKQLKRGEETSDVEEIETTEAKQAVVVPEAAKKFIQPDEEVQTPNVVTETETPEQVEQVAESKLVPPTIAKTQTVEPQIVESQKVAATKSVETVSLDDTVSSDDTEVKATAETEQVTEAVIPWAASKETISTDAVNPKVVEAPKVQHGAVAQSVQNALMQTPQHAQAQAQALNVAVADVAEVSANQLQQVAAAANSAASSVASEQVMLKAAMGAKAAANILSASSNSNSAGEPATAGESSFANQLAQAAGIQQTATGQPRADQAQASAQLPLQLNREMASDQMAERVQMMMSKNLKNIDIRLDPPELGRMQIRMNMNGDGATVHFTVANQQARDALEQSMPRLREMLAQQGVQLGDTSVQQQSSGQQQNRYAANEQSHSGQGNSGPSGVGEENLEADINLDLNVTTKRDGISYYA